MTNEQTQPNQTIAEISDPNIRVLDRPQARSGILARRRTRLIGFLIAEGSAIAVLLLSATYVLLSSRFNDSVLGMSANIVTIAAAAAAAIIPIIFFAIAPVMPAGHR